MTTQFPTMVYKCPGAHQCQGSTYDYKAAKDEKQLEGLTKAGWSASLADAIARTTARIGGTAAQPLSEPEHPQHAADAESKIIRKWLSEKLTDGGIDHDEDMHEDELIFLLFCEFAAREAAADPLEGGELNADVDGNGDQAGGAAGSDDNAPPTRAELEAKAEELGIKFDGRTTDAGLLRRIAAELETGAE